MRSAEKNELSRAGFCLMTDLTRRIHRYGQGLSAIIIYCLELIFLLSDDLCVEGRPDRMAMDIILRFLFLCETVT